MSDVFGVLLDISLGLAAFKLAWSVEKSQKTMAALLKELTVRVEKLENK